MILGNRLKSLRNETGLTQIEVGKKLNIASSTLGSYETDERAPSYETLVLLANFYNVNIDFLLGRTVVRTTWEQFMLSLGLEGNEQITIDGFIKDLCSLNYTNRTAAFSFIQFLKEKQ